MANNFLQDFITERSTKLKDAGYVPLKQELDWNQPMPMSPQDQQVFGAPQAGIPPDWDYRNSQLSPDGRPLPKGAQGWNPDGSAWYGGNSEIANWGLGLWSRFTGDVETTDSAGLWTNALKLAGESKNAFWTGNFAEYFSKGLQGLQGAFESFQSIGTSEKTDETGKEVIRPSIFTYIGRAASEAVGGIVAVASEGAKQVEQVRGGIANISEDVSTGEILAQKITEEGTNIAEAIDWLPDEGLLAVHKWFPSMLYSIDLSSLQQEISQAGSAIGLAIREGRLAEIPERFHQGYEAGRILYSSVIDPLAKEEFLRRFQAGENPYLLAEELQNPSRELAGQILADPFNLIGMGGKTVRAANRALGAAEFFAKPASEFGDLIQAGKLVSANAPDLAHISQLDEFIKSGPEAVRAIQTKLTTRLESFGVRSATQSGKRNYLAHVSGQLFQGIASGLKTLHPAAWTDRVMDTMRGLMMITSGKAEEFKAGISYLNGSGLPMDILMSRAAVETGTLLNQLDPKAISLLVKESGGDIGKLVTSFDARAATAAEILAPELSKLTDIGVRGQAFRAMTAVLESKPVRGINNALSFMYMGLSPGYAVRNWLSNTFHTLIDLGPGAYFEEGRFLNMDAVNTNLSALFPDGVPAHARSAFGPVGGIIGGTEVKGRGILGKWDARFRSLIAEQNGSARITYTVAKQTINNGINTMFKAHASDLIKAGASEADIATFSSAFLRFKGDANKAITFLRESRANGYVDVIRNLEHLTPDARKFLGQYELLDEYEKAIAALPDGYTLEDALSATKSVRQQASDYARRFDAEPIHPNVDGEGLDDLHDASVAVHEGVVPDQMNDLFGRVRAVNERAVSNYLTTAVENNTRLAQNAGVDIPSFLAANPEFKALYDGSLLKEAYRSGKELSASRAAIISRAKKDGDFTRAWAELGATGSLPTDLDFKAFKELVYSTFILPDRIRYWSKTRDALFGVGKEYLEKLSKLSDTVFDQQAIDDAFIALGDAKSWDFAVIRNGRGYSVGEVRWMEEWLNKTDDIPTGAKPLVNKAVDNGSTPSMAQAYSEGMGGINKSFDDVDEALKAAFGSKRPLTADPAIDALEKLAKQEMPKIRLVASEASRRARNFGLHDYGDRFNFDLALGLIFPYQFWYSRTYANWMRRIVTNSGTIAAYAKYKDFMAEIHAGLPEWWKYNINSDELLGIDTGNPLYFNLEQTLNPLNGLTGTDFNDPYKRVNNTSRILDDLGKMGASTWTPYSIANAIGLYMQGEEEAAARWFPRLFPITATLETAGVAAGLDPFSPQLNQVTGTGLFSGGEDPYLVNRTTRALAAMVQEGLVSQEAAIDAADDHTSDIWIDAKTRAINERALGQSMSFMLGAGFKARTASDLTIDAFQQAFSQTMGLRDTLKPDEFSARMNSLREQYPFMDVLLIARKGSDERDAALSWNVLNRLPPSGGSIAEAAGIPQELLSKFYDTKGDWSQWSDTDRERFMAGITDMRAILAIPSVGTRQEWDAASDAYKSMVAQLTRQFGARTEDKVDQFFQIKAESGEAAQEFLRLNPEVEQWMDAKAQFIATNRLLSAYYGGIEQISDYYVGVMYDKAEEQFGANIQIIQDEWENQKDNISAAAGRAYLRLHPELKGYWDFLDNYRENTLFSAVANLANHLPEGRPAELRDVEPQSLGQEGVAEAAQQQPQTIPIEVIQDALGQTNLALVMDNINYGAVLPEVTQRRISQIAQQAGLSEDQLLQLIARGLRQP